MATGSDLSRSLEGGHEPFYDFACSLCDGEGRHVQATRYCEECLVYMCDPCVRNHNKFPLNKRHQLLDQRQFTTVNKSAIVSFPTKRCPKHPGELINVFCGDHDVVCCSVCKAFEHSTCIDTKHLPDAAKDILTSQEYQSIKSETKTLICDVDELLDIMKADISRIAEEKQHVQQTIADFRRKVNKYFDDLEQESLDELDVIEKTIMSEINAHKKSLKAMKENAEGALNQLESFKGDNECDLFVHVKTGKQFASVAAQKIQEISEIEQEPFIQFEINEDIERYVSSLSNLGLYLDTSTVQSKQSSLATKVTASDQSAQASSSQSFSRDRFVKDRPQLLGRFNVKDTSDVATCSIRSICQLSDGNVLVADGKNNKIRKLDLTYKLVECIQMPNYLHCVCPTGPDQVAVSHDIEKSIRFLSFGRQMHVTKKIIVDTYCRGMSYVRGKLLICCGNFGLPSSSGCIKVYNSIGQQQYSIPPFPKHLASVPINITASDDGQHLFIISNESHSITMLDMKGNVINTFSHKDLREPRGICTDGRGKLFACGHKSNTVVQILPKHEKIYVILTEADGIKQPWGICFDKKESRLLVGSYNSDDILVFNVK